MEDAREEGDKVGVARGDNRVARVRSTHAPSIARCAYRRSVANAPGSQRRLPLFFPRLTKPAAEGVAAVPAPAPASAPAAASNLGIGTCGVATRRPPTVRASARGPASPYLSLVRSPRSTPYPNMLPPRKLGPMTYSRGNLSLANSAFSSPAPSPSLAALAALISLDLSLVSHLRKAQAASAVQMPMMGVSSSTGSPRRAFVLASRSRSPARRTSPW